MHLATHAHAIRIATCGAVAAQGSGNERAEGKQTAPKGPPKSWAMKRKKRQAHTLNNHLKKGYVCQEIIVNPAKRTHEGVRLAGFTCSGSCVKWQMSAVSGYK